MKKAFPKLLVDQLRNGLYQTHHSNFIQISTGDDIDTLNMKATQFYFILCAEKNKKSFLYTMPGSSDKLPSYFKWNPLLMFKFNAIRDNSITQLVINFCIYLYRQNITYINGKLKKKKYYVCEDCNTIERSQQIVMLKILVFWKLYHV